MGLIMIQHAFDFLWPDDHRNVSRQGSSKVFYVLLMEFDVKGKKLLSTRSDGRD